MIEIFYILFLFSGLIKSYLYVFHIVPPVDFMILTAATTVIELVRTQGLVKLKDRLINFIANKRFMWFAAFYVWIAFTLIYTESESYSLYKTAVFFTNMFAFSVPFFAAEFSMRKLGNALIGLCLVLGAIFFVIHPITLYMYPKNFPNLDFEPFLGAYLPTGILFSIGIAFCLYRMSSFWHLLSVNILLLLLIFSGSRGAILLCFLMIGIVVVKKRGRVKEFFHEKFENFSLRSWLIPMLVIVVFNVGYVSVVKSNTYLGFVYYRSFARLGLVFDSLLDEKKTGGIMSAWGLGDGDMGEDSEEMNELMEQRNKSVISRVIHYKFSYIQITKSVKSVALGYGIGSYGKMFNGKDGRGYPHNFLLEVWFELGLVGLLILAGFLYSFIRDIRFFNYLLFGVFLFLAINAMKSSSLIDIRAMVGFLALAMFTNKELATSEELSESG